MYVNNIIDKHNRLIMSRVSDSIVEPRAELYVRYVQEKDREVWGKLFWKYIVFYGNPILPEGIEKENFDRFVDPNAKLYSGVACVKNDDGAETVIGFVTFFPHLSTWDINDKTYLNDLYVNEDFRLGGVGRKLIEFVYTEADMMNASCVYWCTDHFNHRAQLLYTKVGYQTTKRIYKRNGY